MSKKLSDYKPLNWLQKFVVDNFPKYAPHGWIERAGADFYKEKYGGDEDFEKDMEKLKIKMLKKLRKNENNRGEHKSDS